MDPLMSYHKVSNHISYNETAAQTHNKYITIQTQTWHNRYITIQTQTSEFRLQSADIYNYIYTYNYSSVYRNDVEFYVEAEKMFVKCLQRRNFIGRRILLCILYG